VPGFPSTPKIRWSRLKSGQTQRFLVEIVTSGHSDYVSPEQRPSVDIFCDCALGSLCTILILEAWLLNASNWEAEIRGRPPNDLSPVLVPLFMLTLSVAILWVVRKIAVRRKIVVVAI